jgi:uncharacterized damage-inducible protein DinB
MSLQQHFVQMARNNAWSNLRLYGACARLSEEALQQRRTSFFPSLWATLKHLWIVDEYYVDGLERGGRGAAVWADEDKHTVLEGLWRAQQSVDARLLAVCEAASNDALLDAPITLQRRNGPQTDAMKDILGHLLVHQIHHRGQVHAMLAGTDVAPPQLDEWFLAADRPVAERELRSGLALVR